MSTEKSNNSENILERFNIAIESLGLNNAEIARIIGFSKGHVGWVRTGKATLTTKFGRLFCSAFNISEHWLITGEGEMKEPSPTIAELSATYTVAEIHQALTPAQEKVMKLLEEDPLALEMFETYIRLPKSKKHKHMAQMLEDLEEIDEKSTGGEGGAHP